uniref:glutathione transferase n=1 Tax=Ciona savignyi TaxID=51511 RepID=H2YNA0_CIOSA
MPTYKLCYFNIRGRGEMVRLVFAEAGVEYIDERIEQADWPARKAEMPFGKMPVLYVDGQPIAHSRALIRYLGRCFNLMGSSNMDAAIIDVWIEVIFEAAMQFPYAEKDETKKAELIEALWNDQLLPTFTKLNEQISKSGGPYILGEKLSVADVVIFSVIELSMQWFPGKTLDSVPLVTKMNECFKQRPNIAAWLEKRPQEK